jgi:dolichol-phosphate mannosyltransferase
MSSWYAEAGLPACDMLRPLPQSGRSLVVLPVYNELPILACTLEAIQICYAGDLLVIDDGSSDGSFEFLQQGEGFALLRNRSNAGAGGVLLQGFAQALEAGYEEVVTLDADGQHNACHIHSFLRTLRESGAEMVWGTRYPGGFTPLAAPFQKRQEVNREITARLRELTGWAITDSFCGFRAYTRRALAAVQPRETGYGMLLEFAVRAWRAGLTMRHLPVPLIYLDPERDFNSEFEDAETRRRYYHDVIDAALEATA